MKRLFSASAFVDFGPCQLRGLTPTLVRCDGERPSVLRRGVRERCPRSAGVYGMLDWHGDLVYVGKAKNLRARLLTYFRPKSRDPKAGRIVSQARALVWEACADEFAALHRELELIRRWRPRLNVLGKPHQSQHTFVCLGRAPAPYAFLAKRPPARTLAAFGPVLAGARASDAVRQVNNWFQLRDCPKSQPLHFAEEEGLFPHDGEPGCLRFALKTCIGPCIAACSRQGYAARVRAARAFLAGEDQTPLAELHQAMMEASHAMQFERAALLRDKWSALSHLHHQLDRLRQANARGTELYPVASGDGTTTWYVLHAGRAIAGLANEPTAEQAARLVRARQGVATLADQVAQILLLSAWFRRQAGEVSRVQPLISTSRTSLPCTSP